MFKVQEGHPADNANISRNQLHALLILRGMSSKRAAGIETIEEIKKCIEFHKLDEVDEMGLTGFEGFVIEQIKEADH